MSSKSGELKTKIVYVLPRYDPDTGSHFLYVYELLAAASRHLNIFLIVESSEISPQDLPLRSYCQRFPFAPIRFLEILAIMLRERLRGREYFYTHYSFYGAVASWLVTRIFGGKAYYWNCGMPWLYRRPLLKEAIFRFVLRRLVLVTGTSGLAEEYRRRYGLDVEQIRILPNWINLSRFAGNNYDRSYIRRKLGIPFEKQVTLFVHRLSRRKGAHLLPEIIVEVTKVNKNAIFIIVGTGPEEESSKFEIRNSKLEKYVQFVGEVPNREIARYFMAADVFLMPSEEEGVPHVLLEAMACGLPYVASDIGGVREITPPPFRGFLVPGVNAAAFAGKIVSLLWQSAAEREELIGAEQEWIKQFGLERVLSVFVELFK